MNGADWLEANQRLLVAEFTRIRARLAGSDAGAADEAVSQAKAAMPAPATIDVLAEAFALSAFERDILLFCAGVEMDGALAATCVEQGGCATPPGVTFALALARLEQPHWNATTPVSALREWRLVEVRDNRAPMSTRLSIDERALHFIAGVGFLDRRLSPYVRPVENEMLLGAGQETLVEAVLGRCGDTSGRRLCVQLHGDDRDAQIEIARRVSMRVGRQLEVLCAGDLPTDLEDIDALALLWSRETILSDVQLLIRIDVDADGGRARRFIERSIGTTFVAGSDRLSVDVETYHALVSRPPVTEQKQLWIKALGDSAGRLNGSLDVIAGQFRVSSGVVSRVARNLHRAAGNDDGALATIRQACQESIRNSLDGLAQRVQCTSTWSDLVLPEAQLATLRQISAHVRRRLRVFEDWGFARQSTRGQGISVLFSGESGTGKTLAAEIIANELGLDLYRIDLASMVSKYIGETEKNLRRVFDAAEDSGAVLLFDEADALFGKRSEVKDSHDRYANIEVSYLLQRMEAYRGLAILTTNLKGALDVAFQRRLRFIVPFPFPDAQLRERLWRGAFPARTPVAGLDHRKLAQLNVAGGAIHNIALNAAFIAAEKELPVGMVHLLSAARVEGSKRERPITEVEVRGWA